MENLFSYGTLQSEKVQLSTFGRILKGTPDTLRSFSIAMAAVDDPEVVRTSSASHHPIVKFSGLDSDVVQGTVFQITSQELINADNYEIDSYMRIAVKLDSGIDAWVYVDARYIP
jgi:hypothetical protein